MDTVPNPFSFNFKEIVVDEIALNGLEGIGTKLLWSLVENRISSHVTEKMKERFWKFIVKCQCVTLYQLPEPVVYTKPLNRFTMIHEGSGDILDPADYLDGPYEYKPVESNYGSSANFHIRKLLHKEELEAYSYAKIEDEYADTLIMVASLEERWRALAPHLPMTYISQLTTTHYCLLELIGKGRENGQMTVGKSNLFNIIKDAKLLFYNRKHLQNLDLIKVHCLNQFSMGRAVKSNLLRLKRFHQPSILTIPKIGKLHDLTQYLLHQPSHSERTDILIKKGILTSSLNKRLQKTVNMFNFEEKEIQVEETKKNKKPNQTIKRKFICIASKSDESSQSEDESSSGPPLKCQYKVGVNLLRQGYERFLEAGRKGLTQIELAQILGIEFYTSRTICRTFKLRNIVREFLEDKGRQRTSRYIAVAGTRELDIKYAEEKNKLLKYFDENTPAKEIIDVNKNDEASTSKSENSNKKKKEDNEETIVTEASKPVDNMECQIIEVKEIEGIKKTNMESLLKSKRSLTLRQLKFANGVMKVIRDKRFVVGFQTLSYLVGKEIGEPPMDTKAVKMFIQKLINDNQVKVLRMKAPNPYAKFSTLICAPDVSSTDPRIKAKSKEVSIRAISNMKSKKMSNPEINSSKPLLQYSYPRYMKIQKLHEILMKLIYFSDIQIESHLPKGFFSILNILPEITVGFALGNISNLVLTDIIHLNINDEVMDLKLSEAPSNLCKMLLESKSLQNSLRENLKVLAMLGLVQIIEPPLSHIVEHKSALLNYVFYLNQHATIIDTTGVWPRDIDTSFLEISFHLKTLDDVKQYWNKVYEVSIGTKIRNLKFNRSCKKKLEPPIRSQKEIENNDTGQRFGDGLGPCGFDACFYMEIPHLWHTVLTRVANMKKTISKKGPYKIKIPKLEKIKKTQPKKKVITKPPSETKYSNKIVCRSSKQMMNPKRKSKSSAIKWTIEEDKILMICRVAITIMSPVSQPGSLTVRNTVAKDILTITDPNKSRSVCHRRSQSLDNRNSFLAYERECLLNELRRRRHLIQNYEGLLKKLRMRFRANISRMINEARTPMMELIWIAYQLMQSKSYNKKVPCVAMNYQEFHDKFNISSSTANAMISFYKTQGDIQLATVKESILLTVMLSFGETVQGNVANQIYSVFVKYPEIILRSAIEQLKKCGAISAKEKILHQQMHKFQFLDIVQFSYKISAFYRRRWINRLNGDFVETLVKSLNMDTSNTNLKGDLGLNCLLFEFTACDLLEVASATIPSISGMSGSLIQEEQLNVIDIESNYKLKSGTMGWKMRKKMQKFSDQYQSLDYLTHLETLRRNTIVTETKTDDPNHVIIYLKKKGENGATLNELLQNCKCDKKTLLEMLINWESKCIVKRLGFNENLLVLTEFTAKWTLNADNTAFIPMPWMRLNTNIRYDIFLRWAGVVLNKVFESPASPILYLTDACEMLCARGVQDICMFLEKCGCVKLEVIKTQEPGLFSDDDMIPVVEDFNPYESIQDITVFPVKDSLCRFAYIRQKMLYDYASLPI